MREKKLLKSGKTSKFSTDTDKIASLLDKEKDSKYNRKSSKQKEAFGCVRDFLDVYKRLTKCPFILRRERFVTEIVTSEDKRRLNRKRIDSDRARIKNVFLLVSEQYGKKQWKSYIEYSILKWKNSKYGSDNSFLIGFMESPMYRKGFVPKKAKISSRNEHIDIWR